LSSCRRPPTTRCAARALATGEHYCLAPQPCSKQGPNSAVPWQGQVHRGQRGAAGGQGGRRRGLAAGAAQRALRGGLRGAVRAAWRRAQGARWGCTAALACMQ
jgi:hypothetical protein